MRLYKYILIIFSLSITAIGVGQNKYCRYQSYAIKAYQDDNLIKAKEFVDSSLSLCPKFKEDPYVWHLRGFIYKDLYYESEKSDVNREKAIESFVKSLELDKVGEYLKTNRKAIKNLAGSYFNDARELLDTNNYEKAIIFYAKFKSAFKIAAPNYDFTDNDIDFNNILAAVYQEQYKNNRILNRRYLDLALKKFSETLELDSMNFSANFNIGVIYYNIGVGYVSAVNELTDDLDVIVESQEKMAEYSIKALPFLKKAAKIKETREVIEGFTGVYKSLNEQEKMSYYFQKLNDYDNNFNNE